MCYTDHYISPTMNTYRIKHYLFECDEYHPDKARKKKMKFNLCDLIEIDDPYNPRKFKLLCAYHNMKREIQLDIMLDLKYGVLIKGK